MHKYFKQSALSFLDSHLALIFNLFPNFLLQSSHNYFHCFVQELLKYLINTSRKGSENETTFRIDPVEPLSLEQFIEDYCLLGFNTSSVIDYCFIAGNQKTLSGIYEGKHD